MAPIWDSTSNITSRSVWVPPGQWQDAWTGETVTGPQTITVSQPYERVPLWHREGGLIVMAKPALRVDRQDWSQLLLEAFPSSQADVLVQRTVYPQNEATESGKNTLITMQTVGTGLVTFLIAPDALAPARSWVVRVHLKANQTVGKVVVDGTPSLHLLQV